MKFEIPRCWKSEGTKKQAAGVTFFALKCHVPSMEDAEVS